MEIYLFFRNFTCRKNDKDYGSIHQTRNANLNGTEEPQVYYRMKTDRNISSKEFVKRTTATLELKAFRQDPTSGITFVGRGSNKVYVKTSGTPTD